MSAIIVACQPRHSCAHLVTDAASYDADGVVKALCTKVFTIPHWPGAISTRGPALALSLLGTALSREFSSLDDAVANIEAKLPWIVDVYGGPLIAAETVEITLVGWSTERGAPESYVIHTSDKAPPGEDPEVAAANEHFGQAYKLLRLPAEIAGPGVSDADMVIAANYEGIDVDGHPNVVVWTMAKLLEMQRRTRFPSGHFCVGGWGQYTLIKPDGIAQYIMQRWSEDRVGELIQPQPMDWARLNATKPSKRKPFLRAVI